MSKPIHRAHKINQHGGVSALCYRRPMPINLARATWTNRDHAVTCAKCKELMRQAT